MSDSGGEDRVGSAWTALRAAEEKLRHAERLAAVGQLAGGIAHDFNNQLSAILGYAELLRRKLPPDSPVLRYADSIIKAAERSAHLNQQLLAFARRGKPRVGAVDLNRVVDAVVTLLSHSLDKRIAITKEALRSASRGGGRCDPASGRPRQPRSQRPRRHAGWG